MSTPIEDIGHGIILKDNIEGKQHRNRMCLHIAKFERFRGFDNVIANGRCGYTQDFAHLFITLPFDFAQCVDHLSL